MEDKKKIYNFDPHNVLLSIAIAIVGTGHT